MNAIHSLHQDDLHILIAPSLPHWVATNDQGRQLLGLCHAGASPADLIDWYQKTAATDHAKAMVYVSDFLAKLDRIGFLQETSPYLGRQHHLKLDRLRELWIHTNNSCNLACTHCLVNSSPRENPGPEAATIQEWIAAGIDLGVERFYFTGGEPFYRPDMVDLIETVIVHHQKELVMISNGMLITSAVAERLCKMPVERLKIQVSLDGATSQTHDAVRGRGSFEKAVAGLKRLQAIGVETIVTTVLLPDNLDELVQMPLLAKEYGVRGIHLMWPHLRGRFLLSHASFDATSFLPVVEKVFEKCGDVGVALDNYESIKWRINGKPGVKFDLSGCGWESLCIYSDGQVYPTAALVNQPALACGPLNGNAKAELETIWRESPVLNRIRQATLVDNPSVAFDPYRFFLGGGDIEHAYCYSAHGGEGQWTAPDPYYPIYRFFAEKALFEIAAAKKQQADVRSGFNGPRIYHAMGEGAIACGSKGASEGVDATVATLHSNCVLAFDVERPRQLVQEFYGDAAEAPKAELCCPVRPDADDIAHIPQEVIARFYGCGSPVQQAALRAGETMMDLGSGAGIDCFIAAKKVGKTGRVIGVDMTDRMLAVAFDNKPIVAHNLGYDVVEFREGYLEKIPAPDKTVDVVTSNCVINLSPDKKAVFHEIWRVLKDGGRVVVSDIVAMQNVPVSMKVNPILWGECISGSLTQEEFMTFLEEAGFYGIAILKKSFWKSVEGCDFYSITVQAFKYEKQPTCHFVGQTATYLGPFKGVCDEEGHYFPRNVPIQICTDTHAKLSVGPLKSHFILSGADTDRTEFDCREGGCCC